MKVSELGERPVILTISARDIDGFCRMAFRIRRSLAWRSADLLSAPRVVKTTPGMYMVEPGTAKLVSIISVIELSVNPNAPEAPW
jgi:hypothetical protein